MKATFRITIDLKGNVLEHLYISNYSGKLDKLCGADPAQKEIGAKQNQFFDQMTGQAQQIFGNDSTIFKDLMGAFAPIVAAGPNQQGFSAPELANLKSQAITNSGTAARNVKQAVGESQAAFGGGNVALPGGAAIGRDLAVENASAENTANQLGQINEANWSTGRNNFFNAAQGLAGAGNVFNSATSAGEAATGSGKAAADTANEIAQANTGWETALMGTLGGLAGTAIKGGMAGGSNGGSPTPGSTASTIGNSSYMPDGSQGGGIGSDYNAYKIYG